MVESFWALPDASTLRTPLSILREQASALTEETHGLLVGEARVQGAGDNLNLGLDVIAPALNDYRYRVLSYRQPVELYPGLLFVAGRGREIPDEAAFIASLKEVLSSDPVKSVLTSLRAQIAEA